ncbi:helicase domain protein [Methanococcus vannielii SB]|uniref:Helicase domain protein n=1 Tax=Methanococcus vannielii (strain ATCC 35089 / DSM 1224 / JCM 13029 / OCM 148 / SB) TaxID=406327 RepID=A6UNJ1_METVS|nr:helicase-related protein [Methanococcus vannielii]ABR54063.1 helicase domain protein [Methanococcus vannielii SB]
MTIIDNVANLLGDDLKKSLDNKSKMKICAAYFSIYAYAELKKELGSIKEFSFLFNSPTFLKEENKSQKEFYINPAARERAIAGGEFEIKLRNELSQKAIAKECKEWIQKKGKFKSLKKHIRLNDGVFIENSAESIAYPGVISFTTDGLGYEKNDNPVITMIPQLIGENAKKYIDSFDQVWNNRELVKDVTDKVINYISAVHKENPPEYLYFITLYNIFNEFLEDISEDNIANEKTGFKDTEIWKTMYNFQRDAVLGAINKLEKYNGCILADSVGLGKTYTALGIIKYYELRNKKVLVLCPKRLHENWNTFVSPYKTNILINDRFNYDIFYHTDLSRETGTSNSKNLSLVNWGNYDLVVIDESHNFRNNTARREKETRYQKLMRKIIKEGVQTKVLMLSATPVNNRFLDLKNQLALAYEGQSERFSKKMGLGKSIDRIFTEAQTAFNEWSKIDADKRTSARLLEMLSFDFFEVLDSVTIARSRKHILKYYDTKDIGSFPQKLKPINKDFQITEIEDFMTFEELSEILSSLNLKIYNPSDYILPGKKAHYESLYDTKLSEKSSLKQSTRETGLLKLMKVNLLKRLESSVESFRITLNRLNYNLKNTLETIEKYENGGNSNIQYDNSELIKNDSDDELENCSTIGDKIKINLSDMDYLSWERDLRDDYEKINVLITEINKITPNEDSKLKELIELIENKINNPINKENQKVIIFSAFEDTVYYIYNNISKYFNEKYGINSACVSGSNNNRCTLKISKEMNNILTHFSPKSKKMSQTCPDDIAKIDILIATDCISEGQNLQDCDYLINYDIHWNPVRIIQRFGRIDRIGSENEKIQLVNFWPPVDLDEYINLKSRVESRMHALNLAATGEENLLVDEDGDLEYRKKQLLKLRNEVIELEDMDTGVSITDLGLNDFRIDLINYFKEHGEIENVPFGLHAIVKQSEHFKPGVIFILKNVNENVNINNTNRLHPFYLVYVSEDGDVITNHLQVKETLDAFRALAKNRSDPDYELCDLFNNETKEGSKMDKYSELLQKSIKSIIEVKEESDINSLFRSGGTSIGSDSIKGLNDFELICFLVIK